MERIAGLLSVGATACFLISAAYLFGFFLGVQHVELTRYLTPADVLNYAFGTLWPFAIVMAIILLFDGRFKAAVSGIEPEPPAAPTFPLPPLSKVTRLVQGTALVAFMSFLAVFVRAHRSAGWTLLGAVCVLGFILFKGRPLLVATYGPRAGNWLDVAVNTISAAICLGIGLGAASRENHDVTYTIRSSTGVITTNFIMPLDRGVLVFAGDSVSVVPWSEIKGILQKGGMTSAFPN